MLKHGLKRVNLGAEMTAQVGPFGCSNRCIQGLKWGLKRVGFGCLNEGLKQCIWVLKWGQKGVRLGAQIDGL